MKKIRWFFVNLVLLFVLLAASFQISMVVISFTNPKLATNIAKELIWKLDGRFN